MCTPRRGCRSGGWEVQVDMLIEIVCNYAGLLLLSWVPVPNEKENLLFLESWKGFWSIAEHSLCVIILWCVNLGCVFMLVWLPIKWPGCSASGYVTRQHMCSDAWVTQLLWVTHAQGMPTVGLASSSSSSTWIPCQSISWCEESFIALLGVLWSLYIFISMIVMATSFLPPLSLSSLLLS